MTTDTLSKLSLWVSALAIAVSVVALAGCAETGYTTADYDAAMSMPTNYEPGDDAQIRAMKDELHRLQMREAYNQGARSGAMMELGNRMLSPTAMGSFGESLSPIGARPYGGVTNCYNVMPGQWQCH